MAELGGQCNLVYSIDAKNVQIKTKNVKNVKNVTKIKKRL